MVERCLDAAEPKVRFFLSALMPPDPMGGYPQGGQVRLPGIYAVLVSMASISGS